MTTRLVQSQHQLAQGQISNNNRLQCGAMFVPEHSEQLVQTLKPDESVYDWLNSSVVYCHILVLQMWSRILVL